MGEQLKIFIDLYSTKADSHIVKREGRLVKREGELETWKKLREEALTIGESLGVSESIAKYFPEEGGFTGGNPFTGVDTGYANLLGYDELKPTIKKLFKVRNSHKKLQRAKNSVERANKYKEEGGTKWFNKFMSALGSVMAPAHDNNLFDGIIKDKEGFKDFADSSMMDDAGMREGPNGLYTSQELYNAVVENGDPLVGKKEKPGEESSAINTQVETETDATELEDWEKTIMGGIGESENVEELEVQPTIKTLPEEIEPVTEKTAMEEPATVETTPTAEETATVETVKGVEGPINAPIETAELAAIEGDVDTSIDTMMQSKTGAGATGAGEETLKGTEEPATEALSVVNNISNITSNKETTVGGETTNVIEGGETTNVIEGGETINAANTAVPIEAKSPINEPAEEKKEGKLKGFFKKASFAMGATDILSKQSSLFGLPLGVASNAINEMKKKKIEKQKGIEENRMGFETGNLAPPIDTKETTTADAESVVSSLEATGISELAPPPPPVTKQDVEGVGQEISSTIAETTTKETSYESGEPSKKEQRIARREERKEGRQEKKADIAEQKTMAGVTTGALEKRLRNIELLLQGPLEVIIKR